MLPDMLRKRRALQARRKALPPLRARASGLTTLSAMAASAPTRLFDIDVQTAPPAELLRRILGFAGDGRSHHVSYVNAHVLNQANGDPALRSALQGSDLVYCDGYGVRLAARLIGLPGAPPHDRRGLDLGRGQPVPGARALALPAGLGPRLGRRRRRRPAALVPAAGHPRHPPRLLRAGQPPLRARAGGHRRAKKPDILLVGMGTPLQERWVEHYADRLEAPVVWTVGALFDYLSHRVPRAPHWLADHGLEWVFRLALEPRRMWRRYLLGNPAFLTRVLRERNLSR